MTLPSIRRACGLVALVASATAMPATAATLTHHARAARVSHAPPKSKTAKARTSRKKTTTRRSTSSVAKRPPAPDTVATLPTLPTLVPQSLGTITLDGATMPLEIVGLTATQPASSTSRPFSAFSASAERMLSGMIDRARSQLGTRYVLGGNRPDEALDCSSFARFAMEALGITLPRTAAQQAKVGDAVPRDRTMLRPGDLLTFGSRKRVSHVGIYLGEGRFIHASVKSGQVIETTIERNTRLFRRWLGARRLVSANDSSGARGGD